MRIENVYSPSKKTHYIENSACLKAYQKQYREENPDIVKERDMAYRAAHKDTTKAYNKSYRAENKERLAAHKSAAVAKEPSKARARGAAYRAKKATATVPWADYDEIANFYDDAKTLEKIFGWSFHVDHIIPINHPLVSGLHVQANLQLLSAKENLSKSNIFNIQDH